MNQKSTTAKAWPKAILSLLALAVVLSICVTVSSPTMAEAFTVSTTTARSNESGGGNNIIAGKPTRITWEARVDEGEEVTSVTLQFPEGSSITEGANVQATVLNQPDPQVAAIRIRVQQECTISDTEAKVVFAEPIASGLIIRLEVHNYAFPGEAGTFTLGGTYTNSAGETLDLQQSPEIVTIPYTLVENINSWLDEQEWVAAWNDTLFLRIFFNPQLIVAAIPTLFIGWLRSILLVVGGFPLAIPIGLGFAFLRMSKFRAIRFLGGIYVNVVRGTPLFLQIYLAFIGLPLLGITVDSYLLGIIVLAMNSSAYLAEIFRAGIQSIHKGQFEASHSLGMNGVQTMFFVIIPQTIRRVVPTATSEFILLFKDTSLLAAVGVMEMMMFGKSLVANTGNMTPYVVAAGFYLIVTLPLIKVVSVFEKKLAASEGSISAPPPKKKKNDNDKKNRAPELAFESAVEVPVSSISPDRSRKEEGDNE